MELHATRRTAKGAEATFAEQGRLTAQAPADGHRRLARQLFAALTDDAFETFDATLLRVISQFRSVLAYRRQGGIGPSLTANRFRGDSGLS